MNRNQTKLLVENWRNLLKGEEYTCGAEFLESCNFDGKFLNESAIQTANANKSKLLNALAVLMLTSSFGGALNKVQAKGLGKRAKDAFSQMDKAFEKQDLDDAEKEEKLLMTMLDALEESGMSSSLRKRFEDKYKTGSSEIKAAIIIMCMKKVRSLSPEIARRGGRDPLVRKYAAVDVAQKGAGEGVKDGEGKDFVVRNGKKFYLTSTKVNQTTFRNQKAIDRMNSAKAGNR